MRQLVRVVLAVALLMAASACASWYPPWYDSLYFDKVCMYYPGHPAEGKLKAELYWHELEIENRLLVVFINFDAYWSGPATCDSFIPSAAFGDSLQFDVNIENDSKRFSLQAYTPYYYPPMESGLRNLGDLFFTPFDTGVIVIDTVSTPYFAPIPAVAWYGTYVRTAQQVNNPGDFNADGTCSNVTDAVWLVSYIFGGYDADAPMPFADANGDCLNNITDVVYLVQYIFADGPAPLPGCQF